MPSYSDTQRAVRVEKLRIWSAWVSGSAIMLIIVNTTKDIAVVSVVTQVLLVAVGILATIAAVRMTNALNRKAEAARRAVARRGPPGRTIQLTMGARDLRPMAATLLAAALLTACSSGADEGLAQARAACVDMGAGMGSVPNTNTDDEAPVDWADVADGLNDIADTAASAASKDPRWNRLADSMNTLQSLMSALASQQATTSGIPALTPEDQRLTDETLDVVNSECRKARAA
ncbi:hypothetical protein ACWCRC_11445 [Streptomyces sp. NPDC001940]